MRLAKVVQLRGVPGPGPQALGVNLALVCLALTGADGLCTEKSRYAHANSHPSGHLEMFAIES